LILTEINAGPFAPVVGYVGAILSAVFLIWRLWAHRLVAWRSPEEDLPNTAPKIVAVLCAVGIVAIWLYAEPATLSSLVVIAVVFGAALVITFMAYAFLTGALTYTVERAHRASETHPEKIVGGPRLRRDAKMAKATHKVNTVQELLRGATYDPDKLWSRISRGMAKTLLLLLFLAVMVSGTLCISSTGFAIQVRLTGKPAAAVTNADQAPGAQPPEKESR
jgi:hypothetical protein